MTILDEIIKHKYREVAQRKELFPIKFLEKSRYYERNTVSLKHELLRTDKSGIITEFKRRSPSKGDINKNASVEKVTQGYIEAGGSALSVLTDSYFFGGSSQDLITAREINNCPILRKDFMVDEYQIIEAKSIGADVILLIASALDKNQIRQFAQLAKSLNLELLFEVHDEIELEKICPEIDMVGINNRNLKTFEVDVNISKILAKKIPDNFIKVTESGIDKPETVNELFNYGYRGFLIGECFMRTSEPEKACDTFIKEVNRQSKIEN